MYRNIVKEIRFSIKIWFLKSIFLYSITRKFHLHQQGYFYAQKDGICSYNYRSYLESKSVLYSSDKCITSRLIIIGSKRIEDIMLWRRKFSRIGLSIEFIMLLCCIRIIGNIFDIFNSEIKYYYQYSHLTNEWISDSKLEQYINNLTAKSFKKKERKKNLS